jgi:DNA-binding transcriptional ArsR family regulator
MAGNPQAFDGSSRRGGRRDGSGSRLIDVLSHPARVEVMRVLGNRVASPKELADELGESVGNLSYHVKYLQNAGCIEITATAPRRGAIEHYYRLTPSEEAGATALRGLIAEAVSALNAGSFDAGDERSVTWSSMELDDEGRQELAERQAAWVQELKRIEAEAAERLAGEREPSPRRFVTGTIGFETPLGHGFTGTSAKR